LIPLPIFLFQARIHPLDVGRQRGLADLLDGLEEISVALELHAPFSILAATDHFPMEQAASELKTRALVEPSSWPGQGFPTAWLERANEQQFY
jgi:hypothetical protein